MKISNSLLIMTMGGLSIVLVLIVISDRFFAARDLAGSTNAVTEAEIFQLRAMTEAISQELVDLQNNFKKLQSIVEFGKRDVQDQLGQMVPNAVEDAVTVAIEEAMNDAPSRVAMDEASVISDEHGVPSPEQQFQYDEIMAQLKDPRNSGTVTFHKLEARALALPPSLQEQVLRDIRTMVNNGEIDVETFFSGHQGQPDLPQP